jgi:hypothetical protein
MTPVCEIERCIQCGHQWTAVFPYGKQSEKAECPRCSAMAGVPQ